MNTFIKISALALSAALVGVSAQAQGLDNVATELFGVAQPAVNPKSEAAVPASGLTRAEVVAELQRARANGEMDFAAAEYSGMKSQRGTVSASDMRLAARRDANK